MKRYTWRILFRLFALSIAVAFVAAWMLAQSIHISGAYADSFPSPQLILANKSATPGQVVYINGLGFPLDYTVQIQLDSPSNPILGLLTCDSSGNCLGNIPMPSSDILAGPHLVIGTGTSSGWSASDSIHIRPNISATPGGGGPGTPVEVDGAGFAANEKVSVYFKETNSRDHPLFARETALGIFVGVGSASTTGDLIFHFHIPPWLSMDKYAHNVFTILVMRSDQKLMPAKATFDVTPYSTRVTAGIHNGEPVTVQVEGYQAFEDLVISWDGNTVITVGADATGSALVVFTPPLSSRGWHGVGVRGSLSGIQTGSGVDVGPGIELVPDYAPPGGAITVNGGGYTPGEIVHVYLQHPFNGVVTTTADASGFFSAILPIPTHYDPHTAYLVYADGVVGGEHSWTRFYFQI